MREATTIDTVVVGAGHAGLAVSRLLTRARREHVVLDRGRVGHRWRTERWSSLRLLTPNRMNVLPGSHVEGDPDGFLPSADFVRHLEAYAASFDAPILTGTEVLTLAGGPGAYLLHTTHATWRARHVIVATGPHGAAVVPDGLERAGLRILCSNRYRTPAQLEAGGVLVVGASASGVQIADELVRSGRDVVLAVGQHTRMPRRYRGMDIFWWLEATGRLARTIDEMPDPEAARRESSLQLVGRTGPDATVDLEALRRRGVRLAGRLCSVDGTVATFARGLDTVVARADQRMNRFLDAVDDHIERSGLTAEVWPPDRPAPVDAGRSPTRLDLRAEGIRTILLATGFRPEHGWIDLPVLDRDGALRQHRGVTDLPGLYVVGQRFQHRRDSGLVHGAAHGAHDVVTHLSTGALPVLRAPHSITRDPS